MKTKTRKPSKRRKPSSDIGAVTLTRQAIDERGKSAPIELRADEDGIAVIAALILFEREWQGMTQETLGDRAGCVASTVCLLETGVTRFPRFRTVVNILHALGYKVFRQEA